MENPRIPNTDFRVTVGLEHLPESRKTIRELLAMPYLAPFGDLKRNILDNTLKANSELLKSLYESTAGFPEERTVETYAILAMQQFQEYFAEQWQSPYVSKSLFRAMLLFHGVDKLARDQVMQPALEALGFSSYEVLIATSIAHQDFFKEYIENPYSEELYRQTCRNIEVLETQLRIPKKDLLSLLNTYFVCTESANTGQIDMGILSVRSDMATSLFSSTSIDTKKTIQYQPIPDRKFRRLHAFVENQDDESTPFIQTFQTVRETLHRLFEADHPATKQFVVLPTSTTDNAFLYRSSEGFVVIDLNLGFATRAKLENQFKRLLVREVGYKFFTHIYENRNTPIQTSNVKLYAKPTANIDELAFQMTTAFDVLGMLTVFEQTDQSLHVQQLLAKQHRVQDFQEFMNQHKIVPQDLIMQSAYGEYTTGYDRTALNRYEQIVGGELLLTHKLLDPEDLLSVLSNGLQSLEMRMNLSKEKNKRTRSGDTDIRVGGSDSVFLWADVIQPTGITSSPILHKYDHLSDSYFTSVGINSNDIWLVIDPSILGRLDWRGYDSDKFGSLEPKVLEKHGLIPEALFDPNVKDRDICMPVGILPTAFIGIISATEKGKERILQMLTDAGIIKVNGVSIENFVIVATTPQDQLPSRLLAKQNH